jgi:hypothetical protein
MSNLPAVPEKHNPQTKPQIIPDREAVRRIERKYPNKSDAEKYRHMQADTLLRLAKASSMDELHRMAETGLLDDLIREHNRKMREQKGGAA